MRLGTRRRKFWDKVVEPFEDKMCMLPATQAFCAPGQNSSLERVTPRSQDGAQQRLRKTTHKVVEIPTELQQ